jgi:hypothetical protein
MNRWFYTISELSDEDKEREIQEARKYLHHADRA